MPTLPQIILKGADWFASMGTEKSKGTKVFALGGKIKQHRPGGNSHGHHPARQSSRRSAAASRTARSSRQPRPAAPPAAVSRPPIIDIPIDYDNLIAIGSMMGSGGLIVMDEDTCMVDIAKFFLEFTVDESCGKCTPCRVGTKRLLEMLDKITERQRHPGGSRQAGGALLLHQSRTPCAAWARRPRTRCSPPCAISATSTWPTSWTKRCPAGRMQGAARITRSIADKCKGCTLCARNCPAGAISGTVKTAAYHRYRPSASSAAPAWRTATSARSARD